MLTTRGPYRVDENVPDSVPKAPLGMPSVEAVQMAIDAMERQYVLPETMQHPVVMYAATRLAYSLMAYGLVPRAPAAQPEAVGQPRRAQAAREHARHRILLVDDVADVLGSSHIDSGMTTDRQMAMMYPAQAEVIVALGEIDEPDLADQLERCMTARRGGDGRPFTCRSAACVWCRQPLIRSWWNGIRNWSAEAATWSLAIIPVQSRAGLRDGVRRLRRGLRDVRDRMARRRTQWRDVCFVGMAGGDGTALVLVSHEGLDRRELADVLRRRWPELVLKSPEQEEPTAAMTTEDAADLGRCRRGIEPLRVVIMPQFDRPIAAPAVEPMPVLV